jgi:hypothetical protein
VLISLFSRRRPNDRAVPAANRVAA